MYRKLADGETVTGFVIVITDDNTRYLAHYPANLDPIFFEGGPLLRDIYIDSYGGPNVAGIWEASMIFVIDPTESLGFYWVVNGYYPCKRTVNYKPNPVKV